MKKIVVANWKMNPATGHEAIELYRSYFGSVNERVTTIVCPPFSFLSELALIADAPKDIALGAQDVFWEQNTGAYTGEISLAMLKDARVSAVIIGHSERRAYSGETDEMIAKKITATLASGLTPILCVGESADMRAKGIELAQEFVINQLDKDLPKEISASANLVIAYEPLWAIGTGTPDTPESATQMIDCIKQAIQKKRGASASVLYGGSIQKENASLFARESLIDGVLVGSASWKGDFPEIISAFS